MNMKPLNFWRGWKLISKSYLFKNTTSFLIIVGIMVILCQLLGCKKSIPPPPTDKIIERAERYFLDTNNLQSPPKLRKEIEVYLDASGSMRGFVNRHGNTVFSRLIRKLASFYLNNYGVSFFKFGIGEPQKLSLQKFWQMSTNQNLFDQSTTHLDSTIRNLLEEKNPASAYLVITDGVQASSIGCDYPSFVNPINRWLGGKNHIFHIYAFRGEFNGTIWSANTGNHFHYKSNLHDPASFRPFYVYAFILDKNLEKSIMNNMRSLGIDYHFLNFSDQIIRERHELDFKLPVKLERRDKNRNRLRRYYNPREVRGKTIEFLRWPDMENGGGKGYLQVKFGLDLTDLGRKILPYVNNTRMAIDVKIWQWKREKKIKKNPKGKTKTNYTWVSHQFPNEDRYLSEVKPSKRPQGKGLSSQSVILQFQRMPERGWYTYYIRILPANNAFRIPSWVENWSTIDDSTSENANRTLNLKNILSSIFNNASIKKMTLADFFVVINFDGPVKNRTDG